MLRHQAADLTSPLVAKHSVRRSPVYAICLTSLVPKLHFVLFIFGVSNGAGALELSALGGRRGGGNRLRLNLLTPSPLSILRRSVRQSTPSMEGEERSRSRRSANTLTRRLMLKQLAQRTQKNKKK